MNVGISVHNLFVVGILAAIFALLARLAARTVLGNVPVLGDALGLLAGGG